MITFALLALAQSATVLEVPDPSANEITLQAVTMLPKLTFREQSALRVLVKTIPVQTDDYIRSAMMLITDGRPVSVSLMPDHVRISVTVSKKNLSGGMSLLDALYHRATLLQDELDANAGDAKRDYWSAALNPYRYRADKLRREEAYDLYRRVFSLERTTIAVGGNFETGAAQEDWARRSAAWPPYRSKPSRFDGSKPELFNANPGGASTIALDGKSFLPDDVNLSGRFLALVALGAGKGSSLHRVWREKNGWSYRQESVLWPVADGWQPRLIASMTTPPEPEVARKAVLDDITAWTEADRLRALGMARGVLVFGIDFSPLYLTPDGAPTDSLQDRTFMAAYWRAKTGSDWAPQRMVVQMSKVSLEDLKQTAADMVTGMDATILKAN